MSKMMRNDREDLEGIRFLLEQEAVSSSSLDAAFQSSTRLEIPELQAIFERMQPTVREMAHNLEVARLNKEHPRRSTVPLDPDWWAKLTNPPNISKGIEKDREIEL
jgi:hypothetical protein